uniref:ornithine decarboxylase n=1 Tax=Candidatus Kentrum eta TaxID=2126337 RepID=A0A450ULT5_9GAMM|nr:MAG: ornithine decarboxylase [Candidatus Kentron sp. H]VFJ94303.1 MAG: ornithine decarboxylase [Candidatus Kentron sp. H]VFK00924.1 MAG: ornithine decarboxylase [Candidatus Kentron sp. H]
MGKDFTSINAIFIQIMNPTNPDLTGLVAEHGSPLVMISRRELTDNLRRLQSALPGVRLHYAVKANPHPDLLRVLNEAGSGFDVASVGELAKLEGLGVALRDIIYTNPIKSPLEIASAFEAGVDTFFYDNPSELEKIAQRAPGARVMLRIGVDNPNCVVDLGAKFGCPHDEAEGLLMAALERGLVPRGVGFHVGSQTSIPVPYLQMAVVCRDLFNKMALAGHPLRTLDIGGGFPVSYKTPMMDLENFCKPIRAALEGYFPATETLAEPGRAICATAATLVMEVIGKSQRRGITWYYLDDGLYGTLSGLVFDKTNHAFECLKTQNPTPCVLAGPTCDSFDVISKNEFLPTLELGDRVLVRHVGAYATATATRFNEVPMANVLMVE